MSTGRKKGLSVDEKRQRLLDLFYEKKEFFQLKELEKLAPKEKGIVAQSVKDILQSLVDDSLVESEKIGTLTCFWSFPSKALNTRKRRLDELDESLSQAKRKKTECEAQIAESQEGQQDNEERRALMSRMTELESVAAGLRQELSRFSGMDPDQLKELQQSADTATDAANRWTDNIFSIKQWCKRKFALEESMLNKQFGIPEELDYMD